MPETDTLMPLYADIVASLASKAASPRAMVARVHKLGYDKALSSEVRFALDWLASRGHIRREPPELTSEPDYYWAPSAG